MLDDASHHLDSQSRCVRPITRRSRGPSVTDAWLLGCAVTRARPPPLLSRMGNNISGRHRSGRNSSEVLSPKALGPACPLLVVSLRDMDPCPLLVVSLRDMDTAGCMALSSSSSSFSARGHADGHQAAPTKNRIRQAHCVRRTLGKKRGAERTEEEQSDRHHRNAACSCATFLGARE